MRCGMRRAPTKRPWKKNMSSLKERTVPFNTVAASGVGATLSGIARALLNRLSAGRLRELDDRMLDDIGLSRSDLEKTLSAGSLFNDPTPALSQAVRARAWRRLSGRHS